MATETATTTAKRPWQNKLAFRTYRVDDSRDHSSRTPVSRVRQLLGTLKTPSHEPGVVEQKLPQRAPLQQTGLSHDNTSQTEATGESLPPQVSDHSSIDAIDHLLGQHDPVERILEGQSHQTSPLAPVTSAQAPSKDASVSNEYAPTSGVTVQPNNTVSLGKRPESVPTISFNKRSAIRLGNIGLYIDKKAEILDHVVRRWDEYIKQRLDLEIQSVLQEVSAGIGDIYAASTLSMVGYKHGEGFQARPTIVISFSNKRCKRKVEEHLTRRELYYLKDFRCPLEYVVKEEPRSRFRWSARSIDMTVSSRPAFSLSRYPALFLEHPMTSCGLKMKFVVEDEGAKQECYATLGGIIGINGTMYGMSTAHTFLTNMSNSSNSRKGEKLVTIAQRSSAGSHASTPTSDNFELGPINPCVQSPELGMHYKLLLDGKAMKYSGMEYSPIPSLVLGPTGTASQNTMTNNNYHLDWALFPLPDNYIMPNKNERFDLEALTPHSSLVAGNVLILCGANVCREGFLTQASASLYTGTSAMDVREILLDLPLPDGASGSWIVRDSQVCGYVVAVNDELHSCFMVSMELAFRDIETFFGSPIEFGKSLNKQIRERHVTRDKTEPPPETETKYDSPQSHSKLQSNPRKQEKPIGTNMILSPIEVAGLTLGIFPLIDGVLEHLATSDQDLRLNLTDILQSLGVVQYAINRLEGEPRLLTSQRRIYGKELTDQVERCLQNARDVVSALDNDLRILDPDYVPKSRLLRYNQKRKLKNVVRRHQSRMRSQKTSLTLMLQVM